MIREFLTKLFYSKPDEHFIQIWTLPGKTTQYCTNVERAIEICEKRATLKNSNVYVAAGLSPDNLGSRRRCPADAIAGITALWTDIDLLGPAHKKKNLPESLADVKTHILDHVPQPSIIVNSGHGLQCWWLLKNAWLFADSPDPRADRARCQAMTYAWDSYIRSLGRAQGWDIDAVWDLARVMRVPGTTNWKQAAVPVPATLERASLELTYDVEDLQALLSEAGIDPTADPGGRVKYSADGLVLDPEAKVNFDKYQPLATAEPKFAKSFNRTRTDLNDRSPSGYDQAITNYCVQAMWTDQEIVDLLIAGRRTAGDALKLNRPDYYAMTIAKARRDHNTTNSQADLFNELELAQYAEREGIQGAAETIPASNETKPGSSETNSPAGGTGATASETAAPASATVAQPSNKADKLNLVSKLLKVRINKIIKYLGEEPEYYLIAAPLTQGGKDRRINLGGSMVFVSQTIFKAKLIDVAGVVMSPMKPKQWDILVQAMIDVTEPEEIGLEATDKGLIKMWLDNYLNSFNVVMAETFEDAIKMRSPFQEDGFTYIFGSTLRNWIRSQEQEKISNKKFGRLLKMIGAEPCVKKIRTPDTSYSLWRIKNIASG